MQFVKGLHTLYDAGARVFVEVGPKRALQGFAADVLGDDDVLSLSTNHPKLGDIASFNQALCGLYAAGLGAASSRAAATSAELRAGATAPPRRARAARRATGDAVDASSAACSPSSSSAAASCWAAERRAARRPSRS